MTTNSMKIERRLGALEKRIAKLEKAAVLFEEHRQAWISMNKSLKKLKQEIDRDKRKELAREKQMAKLRKKGLAAYASLASVPPLGADHRSR